MDSVILASLIAAAATVVASLFTFYATRRSLTRHFSSDPNQTTCQFVLLAGRAAVFTKASSLISGAKRSVIDTTWGNSEENYSKVEREALEGYLVAKERAVIDGKYSYKEIYTAVNDDPHRKGRIESERNRGEPAKTYSAKLLYGIEPTFPMIDFLVVDGEKIILSCLSKDTAKPDHHYLYAESCHLAGFLTQYFDICWDRSDTLTGQYSSRPVTDTESQA
jgi:hypothetical protein